MDWMAAERRVGLMRAAAGCWNRSVLLNRAVTLAQLISGAGGADSSVKRC